MCECECREEPLWDNQLVNTYCFFTYVGYRSYKFVSAAIDLFSNRDDDTCSNYRNISLFLHFVITSAFQGTLEIGQVLWKQIIDFTS